MGVESVGSLGRDPHLSVLVVTATCFVPSCLLLTRMRVLDSSVIKTAGAAAWSPVVEIFASVVSEHDTSGVVLNRYISMIISMSITHRTHFQYLGLDVLVREILSGRSSCMFRTRSYGSPVAPLTQVPVADPPTCA